MPNLRQLFQEPLFITKKAVGALGNAYEGLANKIAPESLGQRATAFKQSIQQRSFEPLKQSLVIQSNQIKKDPVNLALGFTPLGIKNVSPKFAPSVISYIKNGQKVFTKLTPQELQVLRNEVKNIPKEFKGVSQIHLDAITDAFKSAIKEKRVFEIPREEFIKGHPQAKMVFGNAERAMRYLKDEAGKFAGSKPVQKQLTPLIQEARKYKSAEEFKQSITPKQLREFLNQTEGQGKTASSRAIGATKRQAGDYLYSQDRGAFDALLDDIKTGRNPNDSTISQLTDIWNKAVRRFRQ